MFLVGKPLLTLFVALAGATTEINAQQVLVNETLVCEGGICVNKRIITTPIEDGVGGWTWTYAFAEGNVTVQVDETLAECAVLVNDEDCNGCSLLSCDWDGFGMNLGVGMSPLGVKFDCRNFEKGIGDFSSCYSLDPFVYPFERDSNILLGISNTESADISDEEDDSNMLEDLMEDFMDMITNSSHAVAVTNGLTLILLGGALLAL